jgi:hypothetical protein
MTTPHTSGISGRALARFGFGVGVVASIAANVAHSYIPPAGAVSSWQPATGAIIAAGFWPTALILSVEVISRVYWPRHWWWAFVRFGGLSTVAVIAAIISYRHLSALMTSYGEDPLSAAIGPLAVDGLMVVSSAALLAIGTGRKAEASAVPEASSAATQVLLPPIEVHVPSAPAEPTPDARTSADHRPAKTPRRRHSSAAKRRTAAATGTRTDTELLALLEGVPREGDGTVPVRRAASALGCGFDRARRLLDTAGLLRTSMSDATA